MKLRQCIESVQLSRFTLAINGGMGRKQRLAKASSLAMLGLEPYYLTFLGP